MVSEPTWPRERTTFRLYDRRWRPITPLLRVDVALTVERSTAHGFVGHASTTNRDGSLALAEWVTVDRAGRLHRVTTQPRRSTPAEPVRPGDLHLHGHGLGSLAYRSTTDTVVRTPRPPWYTAGVSWYVRNSGHVCAMRSGRLATGIIHTSGDEGRTFTRLSVADVLPASSGPRLQSCDTTAERIVIGTGGENPRWLHTLDRSGHLLSSQMLGGLLDPYNWGTLPDGRLVTGTNRPGLMVATDSTNRQMEYRPGPVPVGFGAFIVGDQLVVGGRQQLHVSMDAGSTWRSVDLLP